MGGSTPVSRLFAIILSTSCGLFLTGNPSQTAAADEWRARVAAKLQSIHDSRVANRAVAAGPARFDAQGRVEADVHYNCSAGAPTKTLAAAGLSASAAASLPPLCVIEGWVAPEALPTLATVGGVTRITLPSYVRHSPRPTVKSTTASQSSTTIDGNALTIMRADQFVSQAGGGGNGVIVGVQSQGVASLSVIQGRHELPDVRVVTSAAFGVNSPYADEGTALLEQVHAIAPNAGLAFCEPQTFVEFTNCLQQFVNLGASVVVDDILFLDQDPLTANSADVQAIGQFLTNNPNVAMFTAAGNDNGSYWEGHYAPVALTSLGTITCANSSQVDNYAQRFQSAASQVLTNNTASVISVPLTFAWADPPANNASNFDVYWVNTSDPTKIGCVSSAGATAAVITQNITLWPGANTLYIATPDASMAGKFLKLWVGGDGLTALSDSTVGSFLTPQTFAPGVITVGAVNGSDGVGNNIEAFSSRGPITVVFPSPATLPAPSLVAPDGIYVDAAGTYFASTLFPDGNFYGTSAAAPNAAGVAALLRGAFPNLTVAQLVSAMQAGAAQLGASVPDSAFGYGRVDAMGALATFPVPTITNLTDVTIDASSSTTSAAIPFTVSGTGTLHFSVASTNTTLVPSSVATSGGAGVAVSPADCGLTTLTCSLTVTAAQYQGGTTTLTVSAVDGAGRAAPATMHVTVNNPQQAPPPPPPGHGGGSLGLWELIAMAGLLQLKCRRLIRQKSTAVRTTSWSRQT
jgi:hypothetical protein